MDWRAGVLCGDTATDRGLLNNRRCDDNYHSQEQRKFSVTIIKHAWAVYLSHIICDDSCYIASLLRA